MKLLTFVKIVNRILVCAMAFIVAFFVGWTWPSLFIAIIFLITLATQDYISRQETINDVTKLVKSAFGGNRS
jgi:Flp pilus assembly protein TadB